MVSPPKKSHITCITLLAELAENSIHTSSPRPGQLHSSGSSGQPSQQQQQLVRPRSKGRQSDGHIIPPGALGLGNGSTSIIGGGGGGGNAFVSSVMSTPVPVRTGTRSPTLHFYGGTVLFVCFSGMREVNCG